MCTPYTFYGVESEFILTVTHIYSVLLPPYVGKRKYRWTGMNLKAKKIYVTLDHKTSHK